MMMKHKASSTKKWNCPLRIFWWVNNVDADNNDMDNDGNVEVDIDTDNDDAIDDIKDVDNNDIKYVD